MLAEILPFAAGIAVSPFPVIPVILLLFAPRARAASTAFLAGWMTGILVATTVFVALADVLQTQTDAATWVSWARVLLGAALVALGVRQWSGRRAGTETPGWMQSIETATPGAAARFGLLLSAANPKIVLLAAGAGLAIGTDASSLAAEAGWVVVFTLVAACSVAVPVLLHAILGDRILPPLGTAKDWLQAHNAAVMAVVITVIGVLLLAKGIGEL